MKTEVTRTKDNSKQVAIQDKAATDGPTATNTRVTSSKDRNMGLAPGTRKVKEKSILVTLSVILDMDTD